MTKMYLQDITERRKTYKNNLMEQNCLLINKIYMML